MAQNSPKDRQSWRKATHVVVLQTDLQQEMESLDLSSVQKGYLRSRWLEQVLWMEYYAARCERRYRTLRLLTILGGIAIPAMVGLNASDWVSKWIVLALGLVVAAATALEEFFGFGDQWRRYRMSVEELKRQGWDFFQLVGPYAKYAHHKQAFPVFATAVEDAIRHEVDVFTTPALRGRPKPSEVADAVRPPVEDMSTPKYSSE